MRLKPRITIALISMTGLLQACSSTAGPGQNLPVLSLGSQAEPPADYVLRIPEGRQLPLKLIVTGNVFAAPVTLNTELLTAGEIHLHGDQASADGIHWHPLNEFFAIRFSAGADTKGASITLSLDRRP
ncbi:MAG: hypothetical protein ACPG4N_06335 [Gammaproteobacteria bacterium]